MKYKLVIFDIDGTIVDHVSSWRFIHEKLGLWDALACKYQERFLSGQISYAKFCRLDAAHWKGVDVRTLKKLFKKVKYVKGAKPCMRALRSKGFKLAAISTGLQFVTERVKKELGFDLVIGNRLCVKNGALSGRVKINIGFGEKGKALKRILKKYKMTPGEVIAVGDSGGDIPMLEAAGYSIAFNTRDERLLKAADYVCKRKDLSEVCRKVLDISRERPGGGRAH